MHSTKRTKIICTLGPATDARETLSYMIQNGMDVARLNFSHSNHAEHAKRIALLKSVREELGSQTALLLDTKGPEIRTGKFGKSEVRLEAGSEVVLTSRDIIGDEHNINISYAALASDVKKGDSILIDDGLVGLEVVEIRGMDVLAVVKNSGVIKDNKSINIPNVKITLPALTPKDIDDIAFGCEMDIDFIAASFIRKGSDVLAIRRLLVDNDKTFVKIIAKIENQEGLDNIDEIIEASDGIMIARGDLGVEIPAEEVPIVQKMIIKKCNAKGKVVITATQMLDSMQKNPRPTRAEVSDVACAIYDGSDAIMLSGESAAGMYPKESLKTMATIAKNIEKTIEFNKGHLVEKSISNAISKSVVEISRNLNAKAIIAGTSSGFTARLISHFRPSCPIIATTDDERVMRQLSLAWGVHSVRIPQIGTIDDMIDHSIDVVVKEGYLDRQDVCIIAAGTPVGKQGSTNLIKVHVVE